jgi:hypothetical protein
VIVEDVIVEDVIIEDVFIEAIFIGFAVVPQMHRCFLGHTYISKEIFQAEMLHNQIWIVQKKKAG